MPGLLAECLVEALFELPDTGFEAGDARSCAASRSACRDAQVTAGPEVSSAAGRGCFRDVGLFEEVAVPIENERLTPAARGDAKDADPAAVEPDNLHTLTSPA
jgi:hypothetical protein